MIIYFTSGNLSPLTLTDESDPRIDELLSAGFTKEESWAILLFCIVESLFSPREPLELMLPPGLLSQAIKAKPITMAKHIFFIKIDFSECYCYCFQNNATD